MKRMLALAALPIVFAYASGAKSAGSDVIDVECDGTTVVQIDASDDRLDKTTETTFHAIWELSPTEAKTLDGPLMLEKTFPAALTQPTDRRVFEAKDGGLIFFKDTGRFELIRLTFPESHYRLVSMSRTETSSGTCRPFVKSAVFGP